MPGAAEERRSLRAAGRAARARLSASERRRASGRIVEHLAALPEIRAAQRVLLTAAVGNEVDLSALRDLLWARGTTVALPVVDGSALRVVDVTAATALEPGWQGVPEPVGPDASGPCDAVVVPALAVDPSGGRLGYGGGHFDRFLVGPGAGAARIGAVFAVQVVDAVPVLDHDVRLDVVVTEDRAWRTDAHAV